MSGLGGKTGFCPQMDKCCIVYRICYETRRVTSYPWDNKNKPEGSQYVPITDKDEVCSVRPKRGKILVREVPLIPIIG